MMKRCELCLSELVNAGCPDEPDYCLVCELRNTLNAERQRADAEKKRADEAEAKYKDLNHSLMCELQDPNGTIWEHARKLQKEYDAVILALSGFSDRDNPTALEMAVEVTKNLQHTHSELAAANARADAYETERDEAIERAKLYNADMQNVRVQRDEARKERDEAVADVQALIKVLEPLANQTKNIRMVGLNPTPCEYEAWTLYLDDAFAVLSNLHPGADLLARHAAALDAERAKVARAIDALRGLYDEQNGPPLENRRDQWQAEMDKSIALLKELETDHAE